MSSQPPIPLSDDQLLRILAAAAPLPRADHDGYFTLVAEQLRGRAIVGDGDVFRAIAVAQKAYFVPPTPDEHRSAPKYDRRGRWW
jgi:hypothetical protein